MLERLIEQTKAHFRRYTLTDLAFIAAAFVATAPAWIVRYPPIQDLPFHLATIRVVHNFHSAGYHFDENFVLTLGRTQYVFYYLLGSFLAYFAGVIGGQRGPHVWLPRRHRAGAAHVAPGAGERRAALSARHPAFVQCNVPSSGCSRSSSGSR